MRIKSLTLKPFAGIRDKTVEFLPGLNVIIGPNEAGKSTLLNAFKSALFTDVNLTKTKYERLMKEYMPAQGGNTIRVYLDFQVDGKNYWLEKIWNAGGKNGSCLFKFEDDTEYTGDNEVSMLINKFLPAQEGTIRNILLTWQSALDRTKSIFNGEEGEVRSDLGNILRASIMETDGISVDEFKEKLDMEYKAYFRHWDVEREEPENNRGINNPYTREVGKVLEAYYEKENVKKTFTDANEIEKEIDKINKVIQEKEEEKNKIQEELEKYEPIKNQIVERQQIENDIKDIKHETEDIIKINDEWTIQGNWLFVDAESEIKKIVEKSKNLEQEITDTRQYLENKEIRIRFEKLEELFDKLKEVNDNLSQITSITREDIASLQRKKQEIDKIENIIMASKLKLSFTTKTPQDFITRDAAGQKEKYSLQKDKQFEKTFQGKLFLEHKDWSLEVQAGEGEIDTLISQKEEITKKFTDELKRIGADNLEEAQSINVEYEKYKTAARFAEQSFKEELGNDNYEEIKRKAENFKEKKQIRSLEEISTELANVVRDRQDIEAKKGEITKKVERWKTKYGTKNDLLIKLGGNQFQLGILNEKLEKLPELPDEFADYKSFFEYLDSLNEDRRQYQDDIHDLRLDKSEKEKEKPELSSEELDVMVSYSEQKFKRVYLEGKAIALIRAKANELLERIEMNPYGEFQDRFKKYFLNMSGNSFSEIEMDDDYPKKLIKPNGSELSYDLLSFGTKDTFSLALRLTMAEYFLAGKEGFLVLDDPLVDMDLKRQGLAAEQINEFAKTKQVIFLTCHTHTAKLLKGECIEI